MAIENRPALRVGARHIMPCAPVMIVDRTGSHLLSEADITPETIGWKGFGLASLPEKWSSPFLVVEADAARTTPGPTAEAIRGCLAQAGVNPDGPLLVRSSGTKETLAERGKLESRRCAGGSVVETIQNLLDNTSDEQTGRIHWLVQEYHAPVCRGHFSNERRLCYEKRDWVLEVEPRDGHSASFSTVAVRQWRDGTDYRVDTLSCNSEARISVCLKSVAMWAQQFGLRLHFEWVWDGERVLLVQLDSEELTAGVHPKSVLPETIPDVALGHLSAFRPATSDDFASFRKLKNAKIYQELGYTMPPFFVLSDEASINDILSGNITTALTNDLSLLTQRPLIIRTDGERIPSDKREMLPRSDELRSVDGAVHWLVNRFTEKITQEGLTQSGLVLIAHHFIPSLASAWARGEPGTPFVRVEALWGIPEGLYWFSHDTYEVDTLSPRLSLESRFSKAILPARKRRRHKGTFVAADEVGKWVSHKTAVPEDWGWTIPNDLWLSEIARTTKLIAQAEDEPVSVMWFVGNHPQASSHKILPWFHSPSELASPKAAPRWKIRSSSDFKIATRSDWEALQAQALSKVRIERVVVEPSDPDLIRDPEFAKALAKLATECDFSVELSGGILSHAYYILKRSGARVECVDLFGGEEEVSEFFKVVRDRVPEVILQRGESARTVVLTGDALIMALKQKLVEEAFEALDSSSGEELIGELADVAEVLNGISSALGLETNRIESDRREKLKKRGGFEKGFMLTTTGTPHSLNPSREISAEFAPVISNPAEVPKRPPYRRPDLRQQGDREVEKVLTVEHDLNRLQSEIRETLRFELPSAFSHEFQQFSLLLELKRHGSVLRSTVRMRREPTQMQLPFDEIQSPLDERQLALFPKSGR